MINLLRAAAVAAAGVVLGVNALPAGAAQVASKAGPVNVESLGVKLEHPWGMTFLPDGRLLVTEKPGRLRVYADGKLSEPVAGLPAVVFKGQGGLQDVEIDPKFAENGLVYLTYTEGADPQPADAKDSIDPRLGKNFKGDDPVVKGGAVARGKLEGNALKDLKVIWRQTPKTIGRGHFGGRIVFAPDGTLFILSGERQRSEPAQDMSGNLGKVCRINPDGSVPKDNPFADKPGTPPDVYTVGNRNPLGGAIHKPTGKLWVNEMGPKGGDELNVIEAGKNYGWPTVAVKAVHYDDSPIPEHGSRPEFAAPVKAWTPVISPSGMIFYSGSKFPTWRGSALIGGLSSKAVIRVGVDDAGKVTDEERLEIGKRIRDVIEAPDGSVWVATDGANGELLRLTPG